MLLTIDMQNQDKLKKAFEDFALLKISFEKFEHDVQSLMTFSKDEIEAEKIVTINCIQSGNLPDFRINVSTANITAVLRKFLENLFTMKELENWANILTMDDDHFAIADNEPSMRKDPALEVLYEIANWPEKMSRQRMLGYISRIKENS